LVEALVTVREALLVELERVRERDPLLADGALAMSALRLADALDGGASATGTHFCAKELREHLRELRELSPERSRVTPLDEIRARRDKRLATG
jgi:hypothetical protein